MTRDELIEIILAVCEKYDALCMDVPWARKRLARAIARAILPYL